jgi:GNAT acetyltransferase-like protein
MSESVGPISPQPAAWDAFVAECDEATVFHTSAWARVWTEEWPGAQWRAIAWQKDGELLAGIGFIDRPSLLGRQVLSMPDGTFGGPIVRRGVPADAAAHIRGRLLASYHERWREPLIRRVHLTWLAPTAEEDGGLSELELEEGFTQVVPLGPDVEALLSRLPHGVRSRVRQAEEAGLILRPITESAGVSVFQELAARNALRHGSRPRPLSLYEQVFEYLVPRGLARFDLVEHDGRVIGGSVHLLANGRALNWLTVADEENRGLRPTHFIIAHWLRELCGAGFREYDLGGSPVDARGLIEFKESWGAERRVVLTGRWPGWLYRVLGR